MIVSILQLMAFPFARSARELDGINPNSERRVPDNQGITRIHDGDASAEQGRSAAPWQSHAGAAASRRQEVKPQPKAGKPAAKVKPAAKPAKAAPKAAKPTGKTPVKPAPAKKAAAKIPAKKAPAKASTLITKKPEAAPKAKPALKPAVKAAAVSPKAVATKTPAKAPATAAPALPRAMPPRPDAATLGAEPARATKPSARLAQITVPSMAQSVASTAAKASYTQTMSSSVLPPPPLVASRKDPKLANNWKTKSVEELTDAEVMAMPDSEYMNEKQMAFFRLKLSQLKQDILNSAGETTEHLREDTVIVPDPADRATIEEEHALELRTRDRERKLLKKIEQSIARIDSGDYGYCDETGEPIGVGRLLARPTATLSLEAQQRRELKQKMFGD
jgi:DnaK suppressor protein